jgi:hypothetical protein
MDIDMDALTEYFYWESDYSEKFKEYNTSNLDVIFKMTKYQGSEMLDKAVNYYLEETNLELPLDIEPVQEQFALKEARTQAFEGSSFKNF